MKIGFFDSGIGGLMILKEVRKLLPEYDYLYFGDTANLPYGNKSEKEIYDLTEKGVEKLFSLDAVLVIVACNTASSESLRKLQDGFLRTKFPERRVLGVIIPTVETLLATKSKNAFLIGTERTVSSKKYERELSKISATVHLSSCATPLLVPLIEAGAFEDAMADVQKVLNPQVGEIDTVILGCTHYVLLKDMLRMKYPDLNFITQDEIIPEKTQQYLNNHPEIEKTLSKNKSLQIVLSDPTVEYNNFLQGLT